MRLRFQQNSKDRKNRKVQYKIEQLSRQAREARLQEGGRTAGCTAGLYRVV